jgi:uncharacterized protein (TIGR02996 family)
MIMTAIADFLETIRLDPDSDLPRLIFADWLEEHGDIDRAEFIRVQCEMARLQPREKHWREKRWRDLLFRQRWLLQEHEQEWLGMPTGLIHHREFRRGFLTWVSMSVNSFLEDVETVFAAHPVVQEAELFGGDGGTLIQLADCPWLAQLRSLDLDGSWLYRADGQVVPRLAGSPYLSSLESLSLANTNLQPSDIESIVLSEVFARLRTLVLRGNNRLGSDAAAILAGPSLLKQLNVLDLSDCHIGTGGARALAASSRLTRQLTRLCLRGNWLSEGTICLLESRFGKRLVL